MINFSKGYFNDIERDTSTINPKAVFFHSEHANTVNIINSTFEDIDINSNLPLINSINLQLNIINSTFSKCYTNYSYLFNTDFNVSINNSTFSDTSNLFSSLQSHYNITNTLFKDISSKNSLPAIINSKNSEVNITDSKFDNLNLRGYLFNEELYLSLKDVKIKNVHSNSKAILHILYKQITFDNLEMDNIVCNGDSGESSMLLYDSGETNVTLELKGLKITNSYTNGPLIKIKGNDNEIIIQGTVVSNVQSYGSIIGNLSKKSKISISNSNFSKNIDNNKINCGILQFQNDISLSIEDSEFNSNKNEGNGGALCFDNIVNMKLSLISNKFYNNKAKNGGAIYFSKRTITDKNYQLTSIIIENNVFQDNMVSEYGGAIYSEYDQLHMALSKNNNITNNKSGIMGAGIYTPYSASKNIFNINTCRFENNTVNSMVIDNFSSNPSYITLNTTLNNETIINVGDYFPLKFNLLDEFNNTVIDITKHYSLMTLKLLLKTKNYQNSTFKNSKNNHYILGNIGTFVNGIIYFTFLFFRFLTIY
ncbi:hypothetical protein BCR36DRAFT_275816 [Piromyces finnis]|uniref:Right handed beta helix domain-containing protein n=1 Tax=Piromyces finnis TaxID=1754191 RepID=A0A1Y1VL72_9FUNG|nr:hypothetical protein BCR36DRAFT_275816 [Piromyces finnis]|eukprot:ORX59217.1 hypothetical protein BCR36DRAFT_275816 [Piromyces finnis]